MRAGGKLQVALAGLLVLLAGCVQGQTGAKAIDPIPAPRWEPGYAWTYDVTSTSHEAIVESGRVDGDTDRDRASVVMTVFNTTTPLLGEDVYYVRLSNSVDHPLLNGNLQAIAKDTLAIAGHGWGGNYGTRKPEPQPVALDEAGQPISHTEPFDPCAGIVTIHPAPAQSRFPVLRFPLDDDQTWTDEMAEEGDDDFWGFQYTARVHGLVPVHVGAGEFQAVYSSVDLVPNLPPEASEYGQFKFRAKAEYWYSPDAQNLVKSIVSFSGEGFAYGESESYRFGYTSTMTLNAYDLTPGADAPAPLPQEEGPQPLPPQRNWQIVADTAFPRNIADGAVPVTFTLGAAEGYNHPQSPPRHANQLPDPEIPETHRIYWRLTTQYQYPSSYGAFDGFGDTFTHNFTAGGAYHLEANVQPIECGASWLGSAGASFALFWEKEFKVPMDLGVPRTINFASFPVEAGAAESQVRWTMTPTYGTPVDRGRPIVYDPMGRVASQATASTAGTTSFGPYISGTWRAAWETSNPTVGDDVTLVLRIDYGDSGGYVIG